MDREIINYYPEWLREFREIKVLSKKQQIQVEKLWKDLESVINNFFLDTLDDYGCKRWENILKLKVKDTATIEERRATIKGRHAEQRPFTRLKLENMLKAICGENGSTLNVKPNEYMVKVYLRNRNEYNSVLSLLERVVPANMIIEVEKIYNTYADVKKLTYGQASGYTFIELREKEV